MTRLTVPVKIRWSDIDGYGHVNNAAMLTLLEEARIAAFWADPAGGDSDGLLAAGPGASTATLIAHQQIEYLAPLAYTTTPVEVQMWLGHLGGASLDVCYEVPGPDGRVAARAMTTLVLVDAATGRPRRLTDEERTAWSDLVEAPVVFRRRPR